MVLIVAWLSILRGNAVGRVLECAASSVQFHIEYGHAASEWGRFPMIRATRKSWHIRARHVVVEDMCSQLAVS